MGDQVTESVRPHAELKQELGICISDPGPARSLGIHDASAVGGRGVRKQAAEQWILAKVRTQESVQPVQAIEFDVWPPQMELLEQLVGPSRICRATEEVPLTIGDSKACTTEMLTRSFKPAPRRSSRRVMAWACTNTGMSAPLLIPSTLAGIETQCTLSSPERGAPQRQAARETPSIETCIFSGVARPTKRLPGGYGIRLHQFGPVSSRKLPTKQSRKYLYISFRIVW
jgi:hypothetical protein